jgi:hypothetical protein
MRPGVQRIDDPHHPRGYRELRSPAEMQRLLKRKIVEQGRRCAICHQEFTDYNDVVPDHKSPKEWAAPGAMTTGTMCRQPIGGVTEKRAQPE